LHNVNYSHPSVGASEMVRDLSAMNHSRSVPPSPAMQWSSSPGFARMEHSAPPFGAFGPFGTSYTRGGNYVGDARNFETALAGRRYIYVLIEPVHAL
jgi:hypothetical protein